MRKTPLSIVRERHATTSAKRLSCAREGGTAQMDGSSAESRPQLGQGVQAKREGRPEHEN